jgi:hypothetical protein
MDINVTGKLNKYFLPEAHFHDEEETLTRIPAPISGERTVSVITGSLDGPKLEHVLSSTPQLGIASYLNAMQHTHQAYVQQYENVCCGFRVKRDGCSVKIAWKFKEIATGEYRNTLVGGAQEINFEPNAQKSVYGPIVRTSDDGDICLELDEGSCYLFTFRAGIRHVVKNRAKNDPRMDIYKFFLLSFIVGIPLSDKQKANLGRFARLSESKDEQLRSEFLGRRRSQELFEDLCNGEIERIKAKGLSPEEEKQKIEDFNDDMVLLKGKFGL